MTTDLMSTKWTEEVVCPHCGYEYADSWEFTSATTHDGEEMNLDCEGCGRPFIVTFNLRLTFSTTATEGPAHKEAS